MAGPRSTAKFWIWKYLDALPAVHAEMDMQECLIGLGEFTVMRYERRGWITKQGTLTAKGFRDWHWAKGVAPPEPPAPSKPSSSHWDDLEDKDGIRFK